MRTFIRTYSLKEVNPLALEPGDIEIETIAHSLALTNRFAGHTKFPISVAQHAWYVSRLLETFGPYTALLGLHHDDAEAYLGDVTKWVKESPAMALFRECEARAEEVIYQTLLPRMPTELDLSDLDWADRLMVRFEAWKGFGVQLINGPRYPPLNHLEIETVNDCTPWIPWRWEEAKRLFILQDKQLREQCQTV